MCLKSCPFFSFISHSNNSFSNFDLSFLPWYYYWNHSLAFWFYLFRFLYHLLLLLFFLNLFLRFFSIWCRMELNYITTLMLEYLSIFSTLKLILNRFMILVYSNTSFLKHIFNDILLLFDIKEVINEHWHLIHLIEGHSLWYKLIIYNKNI